MSCSATRRINRSPIKRDSMKFPLWVVNAFSGGAYSGNPAAVVFVDADRDATLDDEQRRNIGRQMNLSETAFVTPLGLEGAAWSTAHAKYGLRWFTPDGTEVPLCGHATLATATAMFDEMKVTAEELSFMTQSGELKVKKMGVDPATGVSKLCMEFPYNAPLPLGECENSEELSGRAQGMAKVINSHLPDGLEVMDMQWSPTTKKLLVRLPDDKKVNNANATDSSGSLDALVKGLPSSLPDELFAVQPDGLIVRGCIITVSADVKEAGATAPEFHFQSRYFAPWVGIPEDPVTGSAHTVSSPYMARVHGDHGTGRGGYLRARQASARGGNLELAVYEGSHVIIVGRGFVCVRGELDHEV